MQQNVNATAVKGLFGDGPAHVSHFPANSAGSYKCVCSFLYFSEKDIDECDELKFGNKHRCQHKCVNSETYLKELISMT